MYTFSSAQYIIQLHIKYFKGVAVGNDLPELCLFVQSSPENFNTCSLLGPDKLDEVGVLAGLK